MLRRLLTARPARPIGLEVFAACIIFVAGFLFGGLWPTGAKSMPDHDADAPVTMATENTQVTAPETNLQSTDVTSPPEDPADHLSEAMLAKKNLRLEILPVTDRPFDFVITDCGWGGPGTGSDRVVVPQVRLRISAKKDMQSLRIKAAFLEKGKDGSLEVIDEDRQDIASKFGPPLKSGESQSLTLKSSRGYDRDSSTWYKKSFVAELYLAAALGEDSQFATLTFTVTGD